MGDEGEVRNEGIEGVVGELAQIGKTLDRRYDDIQSGKVKLIDGEEAFARLKAKSEAWRNGHRQF